MIKTTAIRLVRPEPMMVTWDLGRRCNYDCSYCEAARHNTTSRHRSLDELKATFNFVQRWTKLYNDKSGMTTTNMNFTGGEPTSNPNFFDFVEYVNAQGNYQLSLTTNGAWGPKFTDNVIKNFFGVTVSYHAEAHENLKKQVLENIKRIHEAGLWLHVNVMLHADHWDEVTGLCDHLDELGIKYNPRPIGDGVVTRKGWYIDTDGTNRRTSHDYSPEQIEWFYKKMGLTAKPEESKQGTEIGRACCGRRCIEGKVDNEWQEVKLINTQFKGWSCSVDQYFLHIDQETELVYHHQTCQALHDGKRGPIGHLKDADQLIVDLEQRLLTGKTITCPNDRCGCGMCVPKQSV